MGPYRNSSDNTAKSKILNFNFYRSRIQLVRCDPPWRVPGAEQLGSPSGPLVGDLVDEGTDQGAEGVNGGAPDAEGGGDEETRTPDPLLAKEMLCQLSYVPRRQGSGGRYWTRTSDLCLIRAAL